MRGPNATYIPPARVGCIGGRVGGSKPTRRPNASGFALQWNIGSMVGCRGALIHQGVDGSYDKASHTDWKHKEMKLDRRK